jgi:hypothetical protein
MGSCCNRLGKEACLSIIKYSSLYKMNKEYIKNEAYNYNVPHLIGKEVICRVTNINSTYDAEI